MNNENQLIRLLGIEYPMILGGMAYIGRHAIAAVVSEAGALGQLACMGLKDDDALREEIRSTPSLCLGRIAAGSMIFFLRGKLFVSLRGKQIYGTKFTLDIECYML